MTPKCNTYAIKMKALRLYSASVASGDGAA